MNDTETILQYANSATKCMKRALTRRCPAVAKRLTALGRPIGERTVRKMAEESGDVRRRSTLENMVLLLGATHQTDRRSFDEIWGYLESFASELRGSKAPRFASIDDALIEIRYRVVTAEKIFYLGDRSEMPEAVKQLDESIRGVNACLLLSQ